MPPHRRHPSALPSGNRRRVAARATRWPRRSSRSKRCARRLRQACLRSAWRRWTNASGTVRCSATRTPTFWLTRHDHVGGRSPATTRSSGRRCSKTRRRCARRWRRRRAIPPVVCGRTSFARTCARHAQRTPWCGWGCCTAPAGGCWSGKTSPIPILMAGGRVGKHGGMCWRKRRVTTTGAQSLSWRRANCTLLGGWQSAAPCHGPLSRSWNG